MSPLRLYRSLAATTLSSRRICAGSATRRVHHQCKNRADDLRRSGRFSASIVKAAVIVSSAALVGGTLYFGQGAEEPPPAAASGLTDKDAATLEEVIAEEGDVAKEALMKPMFEEWMVEYGRRYESEKETTMCYREFKRNAKDVDRADVLGSGRAVFGLNHLSDSTQAESRAPGGGCHDPTPAEDLMFMLGCDAMYRRAVKWWIQHRSN